MRPNDTMSGGETPKSLQAFEDYWDMGIGRTLERLAEQYKAEKAQGNSPPTTNVRQLEEWSRLFDWQGKVRGRMAHLTERKEAELAGERVKMARQRLSEARALHGISAVVIAELQKRITAGEIQKLAFSRYATTMEFQTETVEQDWENCPSCEGKGKVVGALQCPDCRGEKIRLLGKGRRKVQRGTKIVEVSGLTELLPVITRMMEVGHKLERVELGEGQKSQQELVDALLSALPVELRQQIAADLAAALAG